MLDISGTVDPWLRLAPRGSWRILGGSGDIQASDLSDNFMGLSTLWKFTGYIFLSFCLLCVCRRLKRKTLWTECDWRVTSGLNSSFRGQKPAVVSILFVATVFWSLNKAVFAERCWLDFALSWILLSFVDKERFNNRCGRASRSTGVCAE